MDFPDLPPRMAPRRTKQRSPLGPLLNIAITAATLVIGYVFIIAPRMADKPPERTTTNVRITPQRPRTRPRAIPQPTPPVVQAPDPPRPVEPPPPPEPTHHLADLPSAVSLPSIDEREIAILANVHAAVEIALLTNSEALALHGPRVVLNGATVAGVRCSEGRVEFRWTDASSEAAAALSRSLLVLTVGDERKVVALSESTRIDAEPIALKNRICRLKYECDDLTPMEHVRFAFTTELPEHTASGDNLQALAVGDDGLFAYPFEDETVVDTKIRVWKSGDTVTVDIDSRFQLPSGYEKPLTIAEGALRLKKLDSLLVELKRAPSRISRLRDDREAAEDALRFAESMPVSEQGSAGTSSVMVGTRTRRINAAERQLFRVDEDLAYMADLEANEKMIGRDHAAINAIAAWSHLLREVPLRYRFYVLVEGEQLDLVVAE